MTTTPHSPAASTTPARAFHVMAKPTGAICNLDCTYCFYLDKESLFPGSSFRMGEDVLDAYVRGLLEAHRGLPEVVVAFQGGEPTIMGLDFFRRLLEVERRHAQPGQQLLNTLQTNATLLDDEWAAFLAENGFLVGVSVDGPREIHDAYRVDKGGKPTFDRVMRGLEALKRAGVEWNALTTVHHANEKHGSEVYRFLRDDLGAGFMQLIPIVEWDGSRVSDASVSPAGYGRFLVDVFEEWIQRDVGTVFVQSFDSALASWVGMPEAGVCVHAETCGRAVALEHNGNVYSCDHFVTPEHLIGNLADGRTLLQIVDSPQQQAFGLAKRDTLPRYCRECPVRFACNGGCPKDRFTTAPDGEPGLHYLCPSYQIFFGHVDKPMRVMADLLRRELPPSQVMTWHARRRRSASSSPGG